jgi:hypothetical protein
VVGWIRRLVPASELALNGREASIFVISRLLSLLASPCFPPEAAAVYSKALSCLCIMYGFCPSTLFTGEREGGPRHASQNVTNLIKLDCPDQCPKT